MQKWLKKTVRFLIQCVFYPVEWIHSFADALALRLLRLFKEPQYQRHGACQMTGQCCQAIALQIPNSSLKYSWIRTVFLVWHDLRYNFEWVGQDQDYLIYSCRYLKNNKCRIQKFKPKLCRDFPQVTWFGKSKLHKGCGYYYAQTGKTPFRKILEQKEER